MGSTHSKYLKRQKESQKVMSLQRQIKALTAMPDDFRDADVNSDLWGEMLKMSSTEMRSKMEQWAHGPILYCHPLSSMERNILGDDKLYRSFAVNTEFDDQALDTHFKARLYTPTFEDIFTLHQEAMAFQVTDYRDHEAIAFSFIYLKNFPEILIKGLNQLASISRLTYRWKMELTTKNGVTPGL